MNTRSFYEELDALYSRNDNPAVEKYLLDCLNRVEEQQHAALSCSCSCCAPEPEADMDLVIVCNELACFYRGQSRYGESLDAFRRAKRELELFHRENSPDYATVILNMAGAYRMMGEPEKALEVFENAGSILAASGCTDSYVLASLCNNKALVYQELRRYEEAVEQMKQALALLEDKPEHAEERGTTCNNLAIALADLGRQSEADEYITRGTELLAAQDGGSNPHYPAALNTRGVFRYSSGDFAGALADFQEALEKLERIYGKNGDYISCCANCSAVCAILGDRDGADRYDRLAREAKEALQKGG